MITGWRDYYFLFFFEKNHHLNPVYIPDACYEHEYANNHNIHKQCYHPTFEFMQFLFGNNCNIDENM